MASSPHVSTNFGDLLDIRFQKIFNDNLPQLNDMLPELFNFVPSNGRNNITWSEMGAYGDWPEFDGQVTYDAVSQGYDSTLTPLEFASGMQVERKLYDDDQFNVMDARPAGLATAYTRTRQKHGARILNNMFSVDTMFYNNSEGVALCSNSHTTTSGAATTTGFDNLITSAFTATALSTGRDLMWDFANDRGDPIDVTPDEIWFPDDIYDKVFEVVSSMGKVDTANNNRNVHYGVYTMKQWRRLTDANNWALVDSALRKQMLFWSDRMPVEFAFAEDLDTIVAKWRGYARYGFCPINWRWICGANVT